MTLRGNLQTSDFYALALSPGPPGLINMHSCQTVECTASICNFSAFVLILFVLLSISFLQSGTSIKNESNFSGEAAGLAICHSVTHGE